MRVLVVNAGSSSLKVDIIEDGETVESRDGLPAVAPDVDAVGHRIVHGGPDLVEPVVIDADIEQRLRELVDLAPLHQPKSLARPGGGPTPAARRAARRVLRHRLPRDPAARGLHLCVAAGVAGTPGCAPLRFPRLSHAWAAAASR